MLIAFGILGLLQIMLLPALIIRKAARFHGGILEELLQLLPLSLIANYIFIFALASIHLYSRPIMLGTILIELLLILWLYRKTLLQPVNRTLSRISGSLHHAPVPNIVRPPGWMWT